MQSKQHLIDLASSIIESAKKNGASAAAVSVIAEEGFSINVRQQKVETLEHQRDHSVGLNIYFGQRKAYVSFSDTRVDAIETAIKKACLIAQHTQEDPCHGLPEKELLPTQQLNLELDHPWSINPDEAIQLAIECERYGLNFDKGIKQSEGVDISSHRSMLVHANTQGFLGYIPSTMHSISCAFLASEKGQMERDDAYSVARSAKNLLAVQQLAEKAAKKTLARMGARKIKTGQVPVIFHADVARGLLSALTAAIAGSNIYKQSSFLVDKIGEKIFPDFVRIHENPFLPGELGSAFFDGEGVATRKKDLIYEGVLQTYLLSCYSARRLKMQSTGNSGGVYNLFIDTSDLDFKALLIKMDRGLLVTDLMGHGVNMVTGDYSRGASGFWVENGEIQYPVNEITIAGNLKEMFKNIVAVANDVDPNGGIKTGSILLEAMMVAGA